MGQVKRFRADHRHVVETEYDDAQFVSVADYEALQQRLTVAEHDLARKAMRTSMLDDLLRELVESLPAGHLQHELRFKILAALKPAAASAPIEDKWEK